MRNSKTKSQRVRSCYTFEPRLTASQITFGGVRIRISRFWKRTSGWEPNLEDNSEVAPTLSLQRYLLMLLCSQTPSSYRDLDRPDHLLPPLRASTHPPNNTPRHWFFGRSLFKPDPNVVSTFEPDRSESNVLLELWHRLVDAWRKAKGIKKDFDWETLHRYSDEPLVDDLGEEVDVVVESRALYQAAVECDIISP